MGYRCLFIGSTVHRTMDSRYERSTTSSVFWIAVAGPRAHNRLRSRFELADSRIGAAWLASSSASLRPRYARRPPLGGADRLTNLLTILVSTSVARRSHLHDRDLKVIRLFGTVAAFTRSA